MLINTTLKSLNDKKIMNRSIIPKLLFVFIWPFPAMVSVFKDLKSKYLLLFFMLFAVFVGINFLEGPNSDMYRYVTSAVYYRDNSFVEIFLEKDFFYPLVSKLITLISTNFYFITICFTAIYYFIFYKCIKVIADNADPAYQTYLPWFYVLALYTVLPFTVVTAFRFNSAVLFFCWCLLEYTLNKKRYFLYLILLTPFIHFSFLFYTVLPFVFAIPAANQVDRWTLNNPGAPGWQNAATMNNGMANAATYIVEYMGNWPDPDFPDCNSSTTPPKGCLSPTFRITARTQDTDGRAAMIMQTIWRR